jgi:hypothetical protein
VEGSDSYFAAASPAPSSSPSSNVATTAEGSVQEGVKAKGKGKEKAGPVTPEGRAPGYGMKHRVPAGESPSMFKFGRKSVVGPGLGPKGSNAGACGELGKENGGQGVRAPPGQSPPPPPTSPPPPAPTYYVPGALVAHGNSER